MQGRRPLDDFRTSKPGLNQEPTGVVRATWIVFFLIWAIFLTGVGGEWTGGPPGLIQFYRLKSHHSERQKKISDIRARIAQLENEKIQLESNRIFQLGEIRRVLGYVNSDELVFDFGQ